MKLIMTGLDHKRAELDIREKFAVTKEKARQIFARILADFDDDGRAAGCVIISTCNRTELYISVPDDSRLHASKILCKSLGMDLTEYKPFLIERTGKEAMKHLCRVASGLDSQIMGDDQIITQVREALELSREQNGTDSYIETLFRMSIHAAKVIKTNILLNQLGTSSVPEKAVEKIKTLCTLAGRNAVVIGNGKIGRLVSELLIREKVSVTITLRSHNKHKKGVSPIPNKAGIISYDERYKAIENADIVISATTSPHLTLFKNEMSALKQRPKIIVDLAVPRDVEPSIKNLPSITLLTIDDISCEDRLIPPESLSMIESIIAEHITKYRRWLAFKETMSAMTGVKAEDATGVNV